MAKEGREEDKAGKGEEMKKILLLSYRICFPIAITAIFLILLPRVLLFFLPFTLGAVLASDSTWKKSVSFFEKGSAFCFSDFASVFAFRYLALSIDFTRPSFCDEENGRLSRVSSFDKGNEFGNAGNFAKLPSGKFSGRFFGSAE